MQHNQITWLLKKNPKQTTQNGQNKTENNTYITSGQMHIGMAIFQESFDLNQQTKTHCMNRKQKK